jgi:hypothetical protein
VCCTQLEAMQAARAQAAETAAAQSSGGTNPLQVGDAPSCSRWADRPWERLIMRARSALGRRWSRASYPPRRASASRAELAGEVRASALVLARLEPAELGESAPWPLDARPVYATRLHCPVVVVETDGVKEVVVNKSNVGVSQHNAVLLARRGCRRSSSTRPAGAQA